MTLHVQQHYVPEFLLKQWHSGADSKLRQFQWLRGALLSERYTAKAVAKEPHLYSQRTHEPIPNVSLERDFLGPHIDAPAAIVHKKILSNGHDGLTDQERYEWSRFMLSLVVRTPEMVAFMRLVGRATMASLMDEQPDRMLHIRKEHPQGSFREWAEEHRPHLLEDAGIRTLPAVLTSPELNHAILESHWSTVSLDDSNVDALIADHPVVYLGDIKDGFSFMLPISPSAAFVVMSHPKDMQRLLTLKRTGLTKSVNRHLVRHAQRYVYTTGLQHEALIKKHLRLPGVSVPRSQVDPERRKRWSIRSTEASARGLLSATPPRCWVGQAARRHAWR